jgi:hypothetical protein
VRQLGRLCQIASVRKLTAAMDLTCLGRGSSTGSSQRDAACPSSSVAVQVPGYRSLIPDKAPRWWPRLEVSGPILRSSVAPVHRRLITSCRKQLEEAQDGPLLLLGQNPRRRINRERLGAQSR